MHEKVERCQITCLFLIFPSCTFLMVLVKVSSGLQECLENRTWLMHALSATRSSSNQKIANDLWGAIRKLAHICKWYAMICTGKVTRSLAFSMRASSDMSTNHWWCNGVHFYANKQRCIGVHAIYDDLYLEILRLRLNSIACIPNHLLSHFIVCKT